MANDFGTICCRLQVCQPPSSAPACLSPHVCLGSSMSELAGGRGSLRRLGAEQLAIGKLHWSTANYQPLQERALWEGLVRLYDEVRPDSCSQSSCCSGYGGPVRSRLMRLQGLVPAVGVSNCGPPQLQKIARYLQQRGIPLATAQVGPGTRATPPLLLLCQHL